LKNLLVNLKKENKVIAGYAATSKSTTILNYCDIGANVIDFICDTTPIKIGKYSPGMHIPIKNMNSFKEKKPEYSILFAWNHAEEIFEKEKDYSQKTGKWITIFPEAKIKI
jgi:methylation protein EvaC